MTSKFGRLKPGSGDDHGEGPSRAARLLAPLRKAGALVPVLVVGALVAGVIVGIISLVGGGGGDDQAEEPTTTFAVKQADSSWVAGQGSLISFPGYVSIADRAEQLGDLIGVRRRRDILARERAREEARLRAQAEARRKYLEAKARARELFRKAQEKADRLRRERLRKLREQKAEQRRLLAELREKFKVAPGDECRIPEVRATFDCSTGYPF